MTSFDYERERILKRLKNGKNIEEVALYQSLKHYTKESLIESKKDVKINTLTKDIITEVKESIEDLTDIIFTEDETEGFLNLHTSSALTIIRFGLDTESIGRISSDLFNFFLFDLPSLEYGHKLTEEQSSEYFNHLKCVASYYGFKIK